MRYFHWDNGDSPIDSRICAQTGGDFPCILTIGDSVVGKVGVVMRRMGLWGLWLAGCLPVWVIAAPVTVDAVTLQLKWRHQFQFAGYYAAQQQGFFRDEGLSVTLREGGPDISPLNAVLSGQAQYAIDAGELVYHRLQGKPVVALASIFQHSPAVLMTLGHSGLHTPHDLAHKRIGMLVGGQPIVEMAAMFVNEGVKLDALDLKLNHEGMDALLTGQLDADYGYITSEKFQNDKARRDIHYLQPINYGVDFYGDTLFTSERQLADHPEQVAALRRAVIRGWQYALANPDEMIASILQLNPHLQWDELQYEAVQIHELIKPDIVQIGHMNAERWRRMADTFVKLGMVEDTSHFDGFLYDPEHRPDYQWLWWVLGISSAFICVGFTISSIVVWLNGRLREKNELLQQEMQARQEMDRLLRESQRSLQSLIEHLPGMAYRCHHERGWAMEFVSDGCEALTGYPAATFVGGNGLHFVNLIHPDDQEQIWQDVNTAVCALQPFQVSYRIQHRSCEWRWVWEQGHCVQYSETGEPLILEGLILDITSQVDAQQKLQQAKDQVDAAMRAKSIFLANISHEIRTPLSAVTGLSQLLKQANLQGKQREYVEQLYSSSKLLLGIVEDVMDFSCIEAGEVILRPAPFLLQGILQSVEHIIREAVDAKHLVFKMEIEAGIPAVLVGDPLRLSQVLNNLLVNAVKFTNTGSVSLHVQRQAVPESQTAKPLRLQFSVRDTGVGIPASQRDSLFEPFVRIDSGGDEPVKGAGLGLSISRRLVELMGGSIQVESIPGIGSEFSFCADFRVEDNLILCDTNLPETLAGSVLHGAKILLVDDDILNRMISTELLQLLGCLPEGVENATQALAMLERQAFDIILMDIEMPGMKGDQLTQLLRSDARWQHLPIIALTAHATADIREYCLASGMNDYLIKPFEIAQLRTILLRWLSEASNKITLPMNPKRSTWRKIA